jgi:hypothetical protein
MNDQNIYGICYISPEFTNKIKASEVAKEMAKILPNGYGGGSDTLAFFGCKNNNKENK